MPTSKPLLSRRLAMYWRMELLNVAIVPAFAVFVSVAVGQPLGYLSLLSLLPTVLLLVIGGLYWRGKAHQLLRREAPLDSVLLWAGRLRPAALALVALAGVLCAVDLLAVRLSVSLADRVVALCSTALAALEYVNYYSVQLQHFDHWADFSRLVRGRGFRTAHLRADLDARRAPTPTGPAAGRRVVS